MPNVTIGEQDWQTVAQELSRENTLLKAIKAALGRTIEEMERAASEGQVKEDDKPEHRGDGEGGPPEETGSRG